MRGSACARATRERAGCVETGMQGSVRRGVTQSQTCGDRSLLGTLCVETGAAATMGYINLLYVTQCTHSSLSERWIRASVVSKHFFFFFFCLLWQMDGVEQVDVMSYSMSLNCSIACPSFPGNLPFRMRFIEYFFLPKENFSSFHCVICASPRCLPLLPNLQFSPSLFVRLFVCLQAEP